ncbi:MAG: ribbon-helix-helix protein, CopG family [Nitrospirota bacterium]|nr:ribbon-helix-helix protein, CopG family [Nitrospirota bacterium]
MATSLRLSPELDYLVSRLAKRRKQSKSEVIRSALATLMGDEASSAQQRTPYQAMKHLLGCVKNGPPDLSQQTGEAFRKLLRTRQAR